MRHVMAPMVTILVLTLAACGPKPHPEDPKDDKANQQKADDEKAAKIAEQERREAIIGVFNDLVNEINTSIDDQDAGKFFGLMTPETAVMFKVIAEMDMALASITDETSELHVLQQQKDFNVVYTLDEIEPDDGSATLVGVMRDSGNEVRFPIKFIEYEGKWVFDFTDVLKGRVQNMTNVIASQLVGSLNKAIKDGDATKWESTFVEGCVDPLKLVADGDAKSVLSEVKASGLTLVSEDTADESLTFVVGAMAGEESKGSFTAKIVVGGGKMHLDGCNAQ